MDERQTAARSRRWTESQLFLAALLVPLFAYDLTLHALQMSLRLDDLVDRSTWATGFLLTCYWLAADIAFGLFACVLLLVRRQHGPLWVTTAIFLQLVAFFVGLVNTSAYVYFMQTVDALDFALLHHMLRQPHDLALVMAGEITPAQLLLVAMVFLLEVLGPWLARSRALHSRLPPYTGTQRRSRAPAAIAVAASVPALLVGTTVPPVAFRDIALVRAPLLHIIMTLRNPAEEIDPSIDRAVAEARFFEPGVVTIAPDGTGKRRRNLVIILLESTRARSTTPYNPALQTTPFLATLAEKSLVVDKAYAIMPSTAKAVTAVLCSLFPSPTLEPRALTSGLLGRCLPRLLREQGYQTMYMQAANARFENRIAAVNNMGFEQFIRPDDMPSAGFQQASFLGFEDDVMLEPSAAWLQAHKDKPFFVTYLTVNPHHEYLPLSRRGTFHFDKGNDETLDRYLNNLRYEDAFLQQLFQQYQRLGLFENTLFVLVGDHGEAFGEHGRRAHNTVPYEEGLRVPMMFFDPTGEIFRPGHIPGPISQLDVVPTLLPELGFKLVRGRLHGMSVFESPHDRVLMMSCAGACAARVTDTEAFIHHYGRRPDELFDLRTDPDERLDISDQYPQVAARRYGELKAFLKRMASFYFLQRIHRD